MTIRQRESALNGPPGRLLRRADFLAMRGQKRVHASAFVLQFRQRDADEAGGRAARFGLTVTKKTGNAVERNRMRRRLREAVRHVAPGHAGAGFDYVLVARRTALEEGFASIVAQLAEGLDRATRMGANPRRQEKGAGKDVPAGMKRGAERSRQDDR